MGKNKKIKKSIKSFGKEINKHEKKLENYKGKNYALREYWKKEIESMKKQKKKKEEKLDKEK